MYNFGNRLNGVSTTTEIPTTSSPFISVITPNRGNRPRPFQRLQSKTTISSLIQASTTVPPPQPPGTYRNFDFR